MASFWASLTISSDFQTADLLLYCEIIQYWHNLTALQRTAQVAIPFAMSLQSRCTARVTTSTASTGTTDLTRLELVWMSYIDVKPAVSFADMVTPESARVTPAAVRGVTVTICM